MRCARAHAQQGRSSSKAAACGAHDQAERHEKSTFSRKSYMAVKHPTLEMKAVLDCALLFVF
jgi:hypothetical protein